MLKTIVARIASSVAVAALLTAPLAAQTWTAVPGTLSNDSYTTGAPRAFWNNSSNDGVSCNIGNVVTGTNGTCANQRPLNWPDTDALSEQWQFRHAVPVCRWHVCLQADAGSWR
jgi:hypothetical protein